VRLTVAEVFNRAVRRLGAVLALVLGLAVCAVSEAHADGVETLMVPSAAMGRDIPVTFLAGGPHAVVLLDAFNAGPEVSGWVGAGAFKTLAGRGVSVVAPAGGAWSLYTDWQNDPSRRWETFLSTELPDWLVANRGLAPGGHGVVGASQGGTAALTLAAFHPNRYRYAGSMSGFLYPSSTLYNGPISDGMARFGGVDPWAMWGPPQGGNWKWHDPYVHARLLVQNDIRLWVYSPSTRTCSDPAAMIGYCDLAAASNRDFYHRYREEDGGNGHFDIPVGGEHDWGSWSAQLAAMAADLTASIR
jgi:S-formylglutathione hydrolase FrmB